MGTRLDFANNRAASLGSSPVSEQVRLLLSDVDGTLVTPDKTLTKKSIKAVELLGDAGVIFAITSARPPQGLLMFVEPLGLTTPLAAFNGGLLVDSAMNVIEEKAIRDDLAAPIIDLLLGHGLSVWVYQGADWYVLDTSGPHVQHESRGSRCEPTKLTSFKGVDEGLTKVVGVSDDASASAAAGAAMQERFGGHVSATRSQTYFLDVTHPDANKGSVVEYLSAMYDVTPDEIATIGDMHNDVSMFAVSGLSIAMGNAAAPVRQAAHKITKSNDDEGFAYAVEQFVLRL